jgi:hypothetical protein
MQEVVGTMEKKVYNGKELVELFERVGLDTGKYTTEYLAEQLGLVPLSESKRKYAELWDAMQADADAKQLKIDELISAAKEDYRSNYQPSSSYVSTLNDFIRDRYPDVRRLEREIDSIRAQQKPLSDLAASFKRGSGASEAISRYAGGKPENLDHVLDKVRGKMKRVEGDVSNRENLKDFVKKGNPFTNKMFPLAGGDLRNLVGITDQYGNPSFLGLGPMATTLAVRAPLAALDTASMPIRLLSRPAIAAYLKMTGGDESKMAEKLEKLKSIEGDVDQAIGATMYDGKPKGSGTGKKIDQPKPSISHSAIEDISNLEVEPDLNNKGLYLKKKEYSDIKGKAEDALRKQEEVKPMPLPESYTLSELNEAFNSAGLDTGKYTTEYLAEQLGFRRIEDGRNLSKMSFRIKF